jgi:hypothetical protein
VSDDNISRRVVPATAALLAIRLARAKAKLKVAVFSKHLQFVQGGDLAAAELGFDGLNVTVRKGGHAEPASVGAAEDGTRAVTIPKEEVFAAMKRDLERVRGVLAKVSL